MNTHLKVLAVALVLTFVAIPGYAVVETTGAVAGDLTLVDFHKMYAGQKPIVAQSAYERYQYRLKHPAPKVTLGVSRMREGATLADFQKAYAGEKAIVAQSEYEWSQYRLKHPVQVAFGKFDPSEYTLKHWLKKK